MSPIIFLDHIIFPGQAHQIEVRAEVGAALVELWDLEGFGCLETLLAFPRDLDKPAAAGNYAAAGVFAELLVSREDVAEGRERIRITLEDSERVKIGALSDPPSGYDHVWKRPFASWEAATPNEGELAADEEPLARVRAKMSRALLCYPSRFADDTLSAVPEGIVDLAHTDTEPWRLTYLVAELVLSDEAQRRSVLDSDDLAEALVILESNLEMVLATDAEDTASNTAEAFLALAADRNLQSALDAISAARIAAHAGLLSVPSDQLKLLRKLQKETERIQQSLYDVVDAIADHSAGQEEE